MYRCIYSLESMCPTFVFGILVPVIAVQVLGKHILDYWSLGPSWRVWGVQGIQFGGLRLQGVRLRRRFYGVG